MTRATIDFGIDLGTTNSSIAVMGDSEVRLIPNKTGSMITPSAVWIDKRGTLLVGEEAKKRTLCDLEGMDNGDLEFKLRMGRGVEVAKHFVRSGREMTPEELSAEVLKSLRIDVRSELSEEVRAAVITVPAAFENPSTNATIRAAQLAGLIVCPIQLEPVAASLAYGFQTESENVYWLVYDFGGGTFDAAVMRVRDGMIQVVNHDGDNFLGGKLIDWDIVTKRLAPMISEQHDLSDFRRGIDRWKQTMGKLKYYAELAKIDVCRTQAPAEIWIEELFVNDKGNAVDFSYTLTPSDVEEISRPYILRSIALCRKALTDAGLGSRSVERILMVGGSTLSPWVRDAVVSELGGKLDFSIDPVTVVARGAAVFAAGQVDPKDGVVIPTGTWQLAVTKEYQALGNVCDPDIAGQVCPPVGQQVEGFTIEFVDAKTQWRSGRLSLASNGAFMTQLYIPETERGQRHWYKVELCDPTGTQIPISPERVPYTLGTPPDENPPAPWSIGIGLADGSVATYIRKGTGLPCGNKNDHVTVVPLRTGNDKDEILIPILEGESPRAERNHSIGTVIIRGTDVKHDLPVGSLLEIEVHMNKSQQISVNVLVTVLDEDFPAKFDNLMVQNLPHELENLWNQLRSRYSAIKDSAAAVNSQSAGRAMAQIKDQQMLEQISALFDAARNDQEAVTQVDRKLRELASLIDEMEDALEWPKLIAECESGCHQAEKLVASHGNAKDSDSLMKIKELNKQAVASKDPDLLRRCCLDFARLWYHVADRYHDFHLIDFDELVSLVSKCDLTPPDRSRGGQLTALGRRAIERGDTEALKAVNRQLRSLLIVGPEPKTSGVQ